jgi:hypothetical protein
MCEKFETIFKGYCEAVINAHPKYSSAKNRARAIETMNDILSDAMPLFFTGNPFFNTAVESIVLSSVSDELIASYSKSKNKKREKKPIRTINTYTALFIPIVRKVAEPILIKYDQEEENIYYNRITNINSIASKIFKNISDPEKYTDTYVYEDSSIQATAANPENGKKIVDKFSAIVKQLEEDKKWIEEQIVDTPEDVLKETKNELTKQCIADHDKIYSTINKYVTEFMVCYKDALRDLCIDKPLKKVKSDDEQETKEEVKEEVVNNDEIPECITPSNITPISFSIPPPEDLNSVIPPVTTSTKPSRTTTRRKTKKN